MLRGKDTVSALNYQGKLTVFARSVTNSSQLHWTQENVGTWSDWALIGGSSVSLKSDVTVAYNKFSKVITCKIEGLSATTYEVTFASYKLN